MAPDFLFSPSPVPSPETELKGVTARIRELERMQRRMSSQATQHKELQMLLRRVDLSALLRSAEAPPPMPAPEPQAEVSVA